MTSLMRQDELATETENTGINAQGIMGKMGNTWKGVETITKTSETDQGVTQNIILLVNMSQRCEVMIGGI